MAEFKITQSYWKTNYVIPYVNAEGKDEEFYNILQEEYEKIGFPNSSFSYKTFASKKGNYKMCSIELSTTKLFSIWFRASIVGNLLVLTLYEIGNIWVDKKKYVDVDFKTALEWIGGFLYYEAISKMDPNYKEKINLLDLKKTKFQNK